MTDAITYTKKRKMFGRHAQFEDTDTKIVGSIPPDPNYGDKFIMRDPNKIVLSNIPHYTFHEVSYIFAVIFQNRSTLRESQLQIKE